MDLSGPRAITSINALSKPEIGLRLFQRVTAHVLDVNGTTAVLSIEGIPIVAQLTATNQAAALLPQQTAQFIVTQLTNQKVILRMVGDDSSETPSEHSSFPGTELAVRVLQQHNIPITDKNLVIARAVLKQHLPITTNLLNELINSLENYDTWGSMEAELAASLKATGLPVTSQSIGLALHQPENVGNAISHLLKLIKDMASQNLPAEILEQLEQNLQMLSASISDGTEDTALLAKQLKSMLGVLGQSQENLLLAQSQNKESISSETGLLRLVQLQQMLKQIGKNEAAETIGKFLEDIRSQQFLNAKSDWLKINFPLQNANIEQDFSSARLHISREDRNKSGKIDAFSTWLILQVDINSKETIEVDLSILGKQIRTSVTTTDPARCQQAENELPSLEQALLNLGFVLKAAKVSVGQLQQPGGLNVVSKTMPMMAVDIEI